MRSSLPAPRRALAAILVATLVASPALAQPAPSATDKQQAGELTKQAIARAGAKDFEGAIALYLEAYALVPAPQLLSNIGTEYQNAQNPTKALEYFCLYLEKEPAGNLAGYASSKAKALTLELGRSTAEADLCKAPVAPPVVTTTTVTQTVAPAVVVETRDPGKPLKVTGAVTATVGLVVLGFGLYFGKQALDHDREISNHPADEMWMDNIAAYEADGRRYQKLQIAFDITGGALIVAGAALYLIGRSKAPTEVTVTPTASASAAGLSLSGTF